MFLYAGDYSTVSIINGKISIELDAKYWEIMVLNTHEESSKNVAILKEVIS